MIFSFLFFRLDKWQNITEKLYLYNILFNRKTGCICAQYILIIWNYIPKEKEPLLMFSVVLDPLLACLLLDFLIFSQKNRSYFSDTFTFPCFTSSFISMYRFQFHYPETIKVFPFNLALNELSFFLSFFLHYQTLWRLYYFNPYSLTTVWFLTSSIAFSNVNYNFWLMKLWNLII